jgi:hypothetical protein
VPLFTLVSVQSLRRPAPMVCILVPAIQTRHGDDGSDRRTHLRDQNWFDILLVEILCSSVRILRRVPESERLPWPGDQRQLADVVARLTRIAIIASQNGRVLILPLTAGLAADIVTLCASAVDGAGVRLCFGVDPGPSDGI